LNWLRGDVVVHGEMEEMHQEAEKNKVSKKVTLRELFYNRQLRQPLIISMMVMIAQQLSGINVIIFYSTNIFHKANISETHSQYATLGMGAMNVVMTIISLLLVECAGRKTLLLTGFGVMFTTTAGLFVANQYTHITWVPYICIAFVILFVMGFAIGPGSIPWFLVTELFNQSARPAASSVAVTVNWTANFIVGLSFLPLSLALGSYTFLIFAVIQLLSIIFIVFKVPETKNKTVEEITAMFRQQM
ncbi:solute carrier family 2, facilitated glucose transporter member 3, partial [Aphomia sociella]